MLVLLLILLGVVQCEFDYPYACDCNEHKSEEVCNARKCKWSAQQCRIAECDERAVTQEHCVNGSQFYSEYPKYCILKDNKCQPFKECSDIKLTMEPSMGRQHCQNYLCAYDAVVGVCFKPKKCSEVYDEETCNNTILGSSAPLKLEQVCYWDNGCKSSEQYIWDCNRIVDPGACIAQGCTYIDNSCVEMTCSNKPVKYCNGEQVNQRGVVSQCFEKDDKCVYWSSNQFGKQFCLEMVGHTWDKGCKMCRSYEQHLVAKPLNIEVLHGSMMLGGLILILLL